MSLGTELNKIGEAHVPLKWIITFLIVLLIILYFCNENQLFEDMIRLLIPFLIGASVKVAYYSLTSMV
jgi:hypothetical protein